MQPLPLLPPNSADVASPESVASKDTLVDDPAAASEIESILEDSTETEGVFAHSFSTVFDQALAVPQTQLPSTELAGADAEVVGGTPEIGEVLSVEAIAPENAPIPGEESAQSNASRNLATGTTFQQDVQAIIDQTVEPTSVAPESTSPLAQGQADLVAEQPQINTDTTLSDTVPQTEVTTNTVDTATSAQQVVAATSTVKPIATEEAPEISPEIDVELQNASDDGKNADEAAATEETIRPAAAVSEGASVADFQTRQISTQQNVELAAAVDPNPQSMTNDSPDLLVPASQQADRSSFAAETQKPIAAQVLPAAAANMITSAVLETVSQNESRVEVQLDPPELGTVWIELRASGDGMSAMIVSEHDSTSQLIQDQLSNLRKALADSGISVDDFTFDTAGGSESQRDRSSTESDDLAASILDSYSLESDTPESMQSNAFSGGTSLSGIDVVA